MKEGEKRAPELRFKGFTDDWEQRKLSSVAKFFNSKRIPIDSKDRRRGPYPYYGATGIIDYVDDYLFEGEYVLLAEDGANIINRSSPVTYITSGKFWLNNHAHIMKMVNGSNIFLLHILEKQNYIKFNSGTAQPKLNSQIVKNLLFKMPNKNEQYQIGIFLEKIEQTITLHKRKLDKLTMIKKGFLHKLFPQKNETKPPLRFVPFDIEWEQHTLNELSNIVGGGTPNTTTVDYWDGDIDWYSPVEIGDQTFMNGSNKKITKLGLEKSSAKILPIGTLLFTSRAGIGNTAILAKEGTTNQGFQSIVPDKKKLDTYFLFSRTHELKRYGEKNGAGSTFVEISGKEMGKMPIILPKIEEQKIIGLFFFKLDKSINLQQKNINIMKAIKKVYLQKIFI